MWPMFCTDCEDRPRAGRTVLRHSVMVWRCRLRGVRYPGYSWMCAEKIRHGSRIPHVPFHPQGQSLDAAEC